MDQYRNALRVGAAAIFCALALRLTAGRLFPTVTQWLRDPTIQSFLLYLETGRNVRFSPSFEGISNSVGESPAPFSTFSVTADKPAFTSEDASGVELYYGCSLRPDIAPLLNVPLNWDLTGESPSVLILHTHTTESYTKSGESYTETAAFRTLSQEYNMLAVGDILAQTLESAGIRVIHDRDTHDYPSYNGSYSHARKSIRSYLEEYPSIQLVLDLHRDASGDLHNQFRPVTEVNGEPAAQLMVVIGTDASGLDHPDWEDNLALGLKLHLQLERTVPGITRPLCLRSPRFNQDLSPGALLIEVGAAGNTLKEALRSAQILGSAVIALAKGSK